MLQSLSVPLQNGIGFFQFPLPATPSAFLADAPAFTGRRNVGFIMFDCNDTNELTPAYHTGSDRCPRAPCVRWNSPLRAFWPEPVSVFGSLSMTMPKAVHLCWVFHSACPSDRIDARSRGNSLAATSSSGRWRDVVTAASDQTVASLASADRLLRTESQVRLTTFISYRTIIVTTSFRTDAILLAIARGRRNNRNNNKKFMNTTIVSAEAKARLTEAVKNYAPPAPEKYRALQEVKECIAELRNRKASYQTIRTMLKDNAGIEVSHQTIARYCRERLDAPRARKPRQAKTPASSPPASGQGELQPRSIIGSRRRRGPHIADPNTL